MMYTKLPIFRKAMELNVYLETIIRHWERYAKFSIGSELREKGRAVLYAIYAVTFAEDRVAAITQLRNRVEELKITIFLAHQLGAFKTLKQFELSSGMAYELAKQAQAWLGSQRDGRAGIR